MEGRRARLNEFKNTLSGTDKEIAMSLNTNPGFLSQLLNGHRSVTASFAYKISKCYTGFNPDWLITGNGSMYKREEGIKVYDPEPGMLTGVMEEPGGYERSGHTGIVETTMDRVSALEAQVATLLERMEWLEGEVRRLGGGCPGGDDAG